MNKIEFLDLKKINLNYLQDFHNKLDNLLNETSSVSSDIAKSIQDFQTLVQEDFEAGYRGPANISTGRRAGTTTADIPSQAKTSALLIAP